MEKYLEAGELDAETFVKGLQERHLRRSLFPVFALVGRTQHRRTAAHGRRRGSGARARLAPVPGAGRRRGTRADRNRRRSIRRLCLQDYLRPLHREDHAHAGVLRRRGHPTPCQQPRQTGKRAPRRPVGASGQRARARDRSSPPGDIGAVPKLKETHTGDSLCEAKTSIVILPVPIPGGGDLLRPGAQVQGRRGQAGRRTSQDPRRGSDDQRRPRPADQGDAHLRHRPAARRGRGRQAQETLQRRRCAAPAEGPVPGDDQRLGRSDDPAQEADRRLRPVRRNARSSWSPTPATRLRVRRQDLRWVHLAGLSPGGRQGHPGSGRKRRARRLPDGRLQGHPDRRQGARRRLVGNGLQDRRSQGFQGGAAKCKPTILEPIMQVEVYTPEDSMGDVMGDLNSRRGRMQGMDSEDGTTTIKAQVPLAEMLTYAPDPALHHRWTRRLTTWSSATTPRCPSSSRRRSSPRPEGRRGRGLSSSRIGSQEGFCEAQA